MYIKEIKINSFKSFADKVSIDLNKNFTGIVGPNGSGKSNIVDAVKWVLGEQSVKTLRATAGMTDVIFSGSKSRNPSSSASVTIVFDNSDKTLNTEFNEVSIKRIVSKNGENEYYLNNSKCRLKDINDLLIDSFSSKESFNIIPQNKIEEILSEKKEDRRVIFEEAAGVLKYKQRKEETLRKLERTHENIDRINMIIDELEAQVKPLEIASKKAIEYKQAKEKLENIDISLIVKDITNFNELLNTKKDDKEKYTLELVTSSKNYSVSSAEVEKLKLRSIELENNMNEDRASLLENKELLSSLQSKKELAIERSKYDKDSNEVKSKLVVLKEKELKIKNDKKLLENEIKGLKELENEKIKELNTLSNSKDFKELDVTKENYDTLKRKGFEYSAKIDILSQNIENMSKLPYSVKAVLSNPTLKGIDNIIGNVINVKEEYKTMLDVSLSSSANFIIVEDESSAKEAINYLKSNNKGRATFFPLSIIKPKSVDPDVMNILNASKGFVALASDIVEFDAKYYNIVKNQLGNIIVVDSINNAFNISKKINYRYRIVTLEGELLHVGGSLSGGSLKQDSSFVNDRYEIDKYKLFLEGNSKSLEECTKRIKELEIKTSDIREKILNFNIELVKHKELIFNKEKALKELVELDSSLSSEVKDLSNKENINDFIDNIMNEYYKIENICNSLEQKINFEISNKRKVDDEIIENESALKKSNTFTNINNNKVNELEIEIVKINMAIDNLLNRLNEDYSLTYEGAKIKYFLETEEKEARSIVNELRKLIKSIGNVNIDSIDEYERINKRYTFLNNQKEDLLKSEKDLLEIINNMDSVMMDKFESTFNKINKEFSKVFMKLFGGGEASLKLTDPTDLLNTGIELIAIPPGKNMKSISLLSGGEKTLTAISLLFAIMNLKKVPFVILDEVESALDEVNAEKFGEYLSNYRDKTQLLIITHKKKTMEYVDLLYGITMQESGVSKLVSVKLENIK